MKFKVEIKCTIPIDDIMRDLSTHKVGSIVQEVADTGHYCVSFRITSMELLKSIEDKLYSEFGEWLNAELTLKNLEATSTDIMFTIEMEFSFNPDLDLLEEWQYAVNIPCLIEEYAGEVQSMTTYPGKVEKAIGSEGISFDVSPIDRSFTRVLDVMEDYNAEVIEIKQGALIDISPHKGVHNVNITVITTGNKKSFKKAIDKASAKA